MKERVERFQLRAAFDAARIEHERLDAGLRPGCGIGGLEAARHQSVAVRERHPQARAGMRDARHADMRDHVGERVEQLRRGPRADGDDAVEFRRIGAVAAQYLGLRQTERARDPRAQRRIDEVQVGIVHVIGSWPPDGRMNDSVHGARDLPQAGGRICGGGRLRHVAVRCTMRAL